MAFGDTRGVFDAGVFWSGELVSGMVCIWRRAEALHLGIRSQRACFHYPMKNYAQLVDAIERTTSPDELRSLVFEWSGKKWRAISAIAEHARAWDDALVQLILAAQSGIKSLLRNPNRPENADAIVGRWYAQVLQAEHGRDQLRFAVDVLRELADRGALPLSGAVCQDLLACLKPRSRGARMTQRQIEILRFFLEHPETDAATLMRLLDLLGGNLAPGWVEGFVLHAAATAEVRKRALVEQLPPHPLVGCIQGIVGRPDLRNDPELRPRLTEIAWIEIERGKSAYSAYHLAQDGHPDDCAMFFRILAREKPDWAGDALRLAGHRIAPHLERKDIEPFLTSEKREVRMAAISALGLVKLDHAPPAKPTPVRAPAT